MIHTSPESELSVMFVKYANFGASPDLLMENPGDRAQESASLTSSLSGFLHALRLAKHHLPYIRGEERATVGKMIY